MRQVMICAGEASGDLNAGALTKEILSLDKDIKVFGMGGDMMRSAGGEVLFDIKDHGVMGFAEVLRKLPSLFKLRDDLSTLMDERRPSCLVAIDYPDFNMRIAKIAHDKGIPVVYFFSPSAWIWRKGRAKEIAKTVDTVAAVFPFERDVYVEAGANVNFVGHPLLDIVKPSMPFADAKKLVNKQDGRKTVLLLPGSRVQEIKKLLPAMLKAAEIMHKKDDSCDFYLIRANTISEDLINSYTSSVNVPINIATGKNYDIMSVSDVAIATSGTVTLEAALCGLPSVIIYKTSPISAFIARLVIKVKHIGLPNIVAGKEILPELLQEDASGEHIAQEAFRLLDAQNRPQIEKDLAFMKERLGEEGAVKRVAKLVLDIAYRVDAGRT